MKRRFSILSLLFATYIVAAFFAGRFTLLKTTRLFEQRAEDAIAKLEAVQNDTRISIGGTYYAWTAVDAAFTNGLEWKNKLEPPPLSLMEAISICRDVAKTINSRSGTSNLDNWDLDSIALAPMPVEFPASGFEANHWAYFAEYQAIEEYGIAYERMSVVILMDKTVLITEGPCTDLLRDQYGYLPNR